MDANCLRCRQLLSAAMDGEATAREIAFIEQHMATCPDCREAQAAYTTLRSRFQTLSQPVPPPQLRMAVMAQVRGGRAVTTGRRPVAGLKPLLNLGQRLTVAAAAIVIVVLGGLIVWGVLRTPPFEVVDQQANLTDQKVVLTFSQPVDAAYIMANPTLFEVKDEQGQTIPLSQDAIKVENDGKTVEITLPQGALKPDEKKVDVEVKPAVKASDGKPLKNPGSKQATVLPPKATPTPKPPTFTPKPAQTTVAPTPEPATTAPVQTTPAVTATVAPPAGPTVTPLPAAFPTATPSPTKKPPTATAPPATVTPPVTTVVPTTTVAPVTTVVPTTTVAPATTVPITPDTPVPVTTTVAPPPPSPSPAATLASEACKVNLRRGFGKLYNERTDVPPKIGCPTTEEAQAGLTYQAFQRGFMLWHKQSGLIYVFYSTTGRGVWLKVADPGPGELPPPNTPAPSATAVPTITPTPPPATSCASTPRRGFGNIWATNASVRSSLGCPVAPEAGTDVGAFQSFDRGLMFFNPLAGNGSRIYVVYYDGTFIDVPNTF